MRRLWLDKVKDFCKGESQEEQADSPSIIDSPFSEPPLAEASEQAFHNLGVSDLLGSLTKTLNCLPKEMGFKLSTTPLKFYRK